MNDSCQRCRRPFPADGTWTERAAWHSFGEGLVCSGCLSDADWDEAISSASTQVDLESKLPRLVLFLADRLAEEADESTARLCLRMLVGLRRAAGPSADLVLGMTLAEVAAIPPRPSARFGGAKALQRLVQQAVADLDALGFEVASKDDADEPPPASGLQA